jgi:hypothetical protein
MLPLLVMKKKMNTIKQHGKGDNAHQRSFRILKFFKNNNLKNAIKNIFNVNLHHDPIKV